MPMQMVRNDITQMKVDAIVNAANNSLLGGGGVDGAIHRAAGPELLAECRTLGGCPTGEARITKGYRLPAKYVIHTVGPVWQGGGHGEAKLLEACYTNSLRLAAEKGCETVAFPMISTGVYGYPKDQALEIAIGAVSRFLFEHEMTVYLVVFTRGGMDTGRKLFPEIQEYIDDVYVSEHRDERRESIRRRRKAESFPEFSGLPEELPILSNITYDASFDMDAGMGMPAAKKPESLEDLLRRTDEGFTGMLLRKIDEKGMKDSDCYKKANISRKLFSKIRSDPEYRPSKPTALAFAVALELPPEETSELLRKAGFAISHSSKFDIIVEYFIEQGQYNIFKINEALFAYDQPLLGRMD